MARLRDVLDRFRPAGTPGAAALGGVPADRAADQAVELAAVFGMLQDDETRARQIRERAASEAERRRTEGSTRAELIIAQARQESAALRARIVADARARATAEQTMTHSDAARNVETLLRRADELMPEYVSRVRTELDLMLHDLGWSP